MTLVRLFVIAGVCVTLTLFVSYRVSGRAAGEPRVEGSDVSGVASALVPERVDLSSARERVATTPVVGRGTDMPSLDVAATEVDPLAASSADYPAKYQGASLEDLVRAEAQLDTAVDEASQPEFRRRFDLGLGDYVGEGPSLQVRDHDPEELRAFVFDHGAIYEVSLPEGEYPELHRMKAELVWLRDAIDERHERATQRD